MKSLFSFLVFFLIASFIGSKVHAAACCSASGGAPNLLTGDDRAQMGLDLFGGYVVGDVPAHGPAVFLGDNETEIDSGLDLSGSYLISDRWQIGGQLPFRYQRVEENSTEESDSGIGDVQVNVAYEFLPEWNYSVWRPKGYLFLRQTFPTGPSIYESTSAYGTDAFGKGFFTTGAGFFLIKRFSNWDFSWTGSGQYSFSREFNSATEVSPGWGTQTLISVGWTPHHAPVRLGMRVGPTYQQPKTIENSIGESRTPYQLVWDLGADLGYEVNTHSSLTLSYTDQTILGPVKNTKLMRTFLLAYQFRWER